MSEEKLLTIRDVSLLLGISEKEVMDLAESGVVPAYKVGGVYLRFKQEQIDQFKKTHKISSRHKQKKIMQDYPLKDRLRDFLYFNDFYIISILLIVFILMIIFRD